MIKKLITKIINKVKGAPTVTAKERGHEEKTRHTARRSSPSPTKKTRTSTKSALPSPKNKKQSSHAKHLEPVIFHRKEHGIPLENVSKNAIRVIEALKEKGFEAYIVGGAVRDLIVGIPPKDFDVATDATPEEIKNLFRRAFIIGKRFRIVHVLFGKDLIEVTTFRDASEEGERDVHGRILHDNTYGGSLADDAARRDFTVNALYYDPTNEKVYDFHQGIQDIQHQTLRIIGDPELRYREDPVRMLRVVRFAAKLKFTIDSQTQAPIKKMAELIDNVPKARIQDEMLKLLTSGHAMACLHELRKAGLHHGLLPLLDVILEQPLGEKFVSLALERTDARIREGKHISPGFLFASLLWHQVLEKSLAYQANGQYPIPALMQAADEVIELQTDALALQRKTSTDMRDIWAMQTRFERLTGKYPHRLIENPRFRAGYDFMLLRCESGELPEALGAWWTDFYETHPSDELSRHELMQQAPSVMALLKPEHTPPTPSKKKRRSRRGSRKKSHAESHTENSDVSEE